MKIDKRVITKISLVVVLLAAMVVLTGCDGFTIPDISLPIDTGSVVLNTIINVIWHILAYGVLLVVAVVVGVWLVAHAAVVGVVALVVGIVTAIIKFITGLF